MDAPDPTSAAALPVAEFAFPGGLRDHLVSAILDGRKTGTTALMVEYEREQEPLPRVGDQSALVDSAGQLVAILQITDVRVVALGEVDLQHVRDEGEGHLTVAQWRRAHEGFWHSAEMRQELGDSGFQVDDSTVVVFGALPPPFSPFRLMLGWSHFSGASGRSRPSKAKRIHP